MTTVLEADLELSAHDACCAVCDDDDERVPYPSLHALERDDDDGEWLDDLDY